MTQIDPSYRLRSRTEGRLGAGGSGGPSLHGTGAINIEVHEFRRLPGGGVHEARRALERLHDLLNNFASGGGPTARVTIKTILLQKELKDAQHVEGLAGHEDVLDIGWRFFGGDEFHDVDTRGRNKALPSATIFSKKKGAGRKMRIPIAPQSS